MVTSLNDLSQQFRAARLASRLTQREAAAAAGVSGVLVSQFERGALTELGAVKLISLLRSVGLQLHLRPAGHQRILNDIAAELDIASAPDLSERPAQHFRERTAQRVRHSRKRV